ncbi:hypothetical protein VaNZ11_014394, partial [Volvox africanus]
VSQSPIMARSHIPLSHEALMLDVLQNLPSPGGRNIMFHELEFSLATERSLNTVAWADLPPSCDPVFILDNLANNTRRKGNMDQQLSQMVLGRAGESTRVATIPSPGTVSRGAVKRWQVESFATVLRHLLHDTDRHLHVVDFGCGTGTLLLPLAVLFPHCTFTVHYNCSAADQGMDLELTLAKLFVELFVVTPQHTR